MNYYCLVAGLPDITLDDSKLAITAKELLELLVQEVTSKKDLELLRIYRLHWDNENLLAYLQDSEAVFRLESTIEREEWAECITALKSEDPFKNPRIPAFYVTFLSEYLGSDEDKTSFLWENRLAGLYYEYAIGQKNQFASQWYEFNLDLNNILTATFAKKFGIDVASNTVGDNEVAHKIRTSMARDFGVSDLFPMFESLQRLLDDPNLIEREKRIDALRWQWLEEQTVYHYFSMEKVFSYILQLDLLERWTGMNHEAGERQFRAIIDELKQGVEIPTL